MGSILSTSGINQLISSFKQNEYNKRISPLEIKRDKYNNLSSAWNTVETNLNSLKDSLSSLRYTSTSNLFNSMSATVSDEKFVSVTASKGATPSAYSLRVNQLAKNDLLVSTALTADTAVTSLSGTHKFKIQSGDFISNVEVSLTGSETNKSVMDALTKAINEDKAIITSTDPGSSITDSGELSFDINGTTTKVAYNYSGKSYDEVITDLVQQINDNVDGVLAENDNGNLKITVTNSENYISISDSSGSLASTLGITATKEKAASAISTASAFAPDSSNYKFSLTADNSGYDNRLIINNISGGLLDHIGLNSTVLTNRTAGGDTNAGFMYVANSATDNELNSKFVFNGINVQRNSNSFTDLVSNVTFDLKAKMEATDNDVSVTVEHDKSEIKKEIEDFISKFNTAYTYMKSNYTSGKSGRGVFTGDSNINKLMRDMQSIATSDVAGLEAYDINSLRDIGITFDPDTGLTLSDTTKFNSAIDEKSDQMAALFNSTNGVANRLYDILDNYLGSSGTIANVKSSLDRNVSYYKDKIESTNEQIDKQAEILRSQYEQLQMQYATLLSQQSFYQSLGGGYF